jgi:CRP-like cAMP-binding protein
MIMKIKDILLDVSYFEKLENIDSLIEKRCIKIKNFEKNNTIREVNEECKWVDIVVSGVIIAYSLNENGNSTTMFEFEPGSIIGANLILTGGVYPLNFYSKNETKIISLSKKCIEELLHNYDFTIKFFKALSINSQNLNKKVFIFHKKTIRENLLDYFTTQANLQKSSTFTLPISKKELADYLGVQRQSLFRELKLLREENIIKIENRKITLL